MSRLYIHVIMIRVSIITDHVHDDVHDLDTHQGPRGRVSPSLSSDDRGLGSTFSLFTPSIAGDPGQFYVKSRSGSPAKELLASHPATPYNSIRKRIKSVSIKYLKHRQKKRDERRTDEIDPANSSFEFFETREVGRPPPMGGGRREVLEKEKRGAGEAEEERPRPGLEEKKRGSREE